MVGRQRGRWLSTINFLLNDLYLDSREYYGAELREWTPSGIAEVSAGGSAERSPIVWKKKEKKKCQSTSYAATFVQFQFDIVSRSKESILEGTIMYLNNLYFINRPDNYISILYTKAPFHSFSLTYTNTSRGEFVVEATCALPPWVRLPWGWFGMMTGKTIGSARRGIHSTGIPYRSRTWTWLSPSDADSICSRAINHYQWPLLVAVGGGICWFTGRGDSGIISVIREIRGYGRWRGRSNLHYDGWRVG